ncbi:hypothetical protein AAG570_004325 [Ranatra chinensis]|uniref:Uncharacterized protein n=1 Tax=Ranatra chinensis TaxID=642074 RepID=A0ABD0Y1E0_9HEMI
MGRGDTRAVWWGATNERARYNAPGPPPGAPIWRPAQCYFCGGPPSCTSPDRSQPVSTSSTGSYLPPKVSPYPLPHLPARYLPVRPVSPRPGCSRRRGRTLRRTVFADSPASVTGVPVMPVSPSESTALHGSQAPLFPS